jgi:altronate dehydratase
VCLYQLGAAFSDLLDRTSSLVAPLLWTSANAATAAALEGQLDFSAAPVLTGEETVEQAGERLLELVLDVASGTLASSETLAPTDPQQLYLTDPAF